MFLNTKNESNFDALDLISNSKGFAIVAIMQDGSIQNIVECEQFTQIENVGFIDCAYKLAECVIDKVNELKECKND